jgi:hypothetical protein
MTDSALLAAYGRGNAHWRDTGCEIAPSCLSCPLPRCKYDSVIDMRQSRPAERDQEMQEARAAGATIVALMEDFRVGRRTVFRALTKA